MLRPFCFGGSMRLIVLAGAAMAASLMFAGPISAQSDTPASATAGTARIYVIRPSSFAWFHRYAEIAIDEMVAGGIGNGGCAYVDVPAGEHKVGVGWPLLVLTLDFPEPAVEVAQIFEAGRTYHFRFDVDVEGCYAGYGQVCHQYSWVLNALGTDYPANPRCKPLTVSNKRSKLASTTFKR